MKPEDLLRRLDNHDWECGYCGDLISHGEQVAVGYDNNVIVHFSCIPTYNAPARPS